MTRDEAEMLAIKAVGFEFSEDARRFLSIMEALGMLKLDEPKSADERFHEAMKKHGYYPTVGEQVAIIINGAGLKITEK